MRILVVQESDWLERGPHQSHHVMERLALRGHEIRVIDFEIDWRLRSSGIILPDRVIHRNVHKATPDGRVTVIRPPTIRAPILEYLSLLVTHYCEISRQMKDFKPQAIVGFGILNSWIAIRLAARHQVPFIHYVIDELQRLVPQPALRGLADKIERNNMRHSTIVAAINEGLRDYSIDMGASPHDTVVVRAGIDLERFSRSANRETLRKALGFRDNDVVLFFMGWLYNFSGLKEVVSHMGAAPREETTIKLIILGKGEASRELSELCAKHRLADRVSLIDWKPYEEIPDYLASSDICILPAYKNDVMRNIVPIKMYEYMAAGKPVIATRLPGLVKEFGDNNGVTYIEDPEDLIDVARELARKGALADEGMKARKYVQANDWDGIVSMFERVLQDATTR